MVTSAKTPRETIRRWNRDFERRRRARRGAAGVCLRCGDQPKAGRRFCLKCIAYGIERRKKAKENGFCVTCLKRRRMPQRQTCELCWKSSIDASKRLKIRTFNAYGGICACCGESELSFLQIDHINGGGRKHRKEIKSWGGANFYRWLEKRGFPEGYQVLCANCNSAKSLLSECPHKNTTD
jgi:hypothetical protein